MDHQILDCGLPNLQSARCVVEPNFEPPRDDVGSECSQTHTDGTQDRGGRQPMIALHVMKNCPRSIVHLHP